MTCLASFGPFSIVYGPYPSIPAVVGGHWMLEACLYLFGGTVHSGSGSMVVVVDVDMLRRRRKAGDIKSQ